jgi:hypothetical protein
VRTVSLALLIGIATVLGVRAVPIVGKAAANQTDDDDFDATAAIAGFNAEAVGCAGVDVDGSKLDPEVQDRRCAVMNGWRMMLEDHDYCFDQRKQEWARCTTSE